jgi:hypothetical protein
MQAFFATWPSGRKAKWRSLTWAEYKRFEHQLTYDSPACVYADVYGTVLIEGPPLDGDPVFQAPAGLVEWIAKAMLNNPFSGEYERLKPALDMKRAELSASYLESAKAIVAGIFRYTFEEIEQWDAEMFFERLAAAEFVSGRKLEPGDPRKRQKKPGPNDPKKERLPKKELTLAQQRVIDRVNHR